MQGEPSVQESTPFGAVFLSYASQDAKAAQRICEALRNAGIEVWFDQSALRGGDVWDQTIRRQIRDCALFVAVTSDNTAARHEGYFRLEWDLADQRTHMMARNRVFIMPVYLGTTPVSGYDVPESFHRVQWTGLPDGETPPAFVERIRKLLSPEASAAWVAATAAPSSLPTVRTSKKLVPGTWRSTAPLWTIGAVLSAALLYVVADRFWFASHSTKSRVTENATTIPGTPLAITTPFNPPPHSIAVLPFVNMSGDKEQEYFSDGLTEELLNSLARIDELQVSARTSSFSFKSKDIDIATIARKLNVAAVLEGSVRRSGRTVRITAQLNDAVTGFHLWSQTYDRDLKDVLLLQTDIATSVANALKVMLFSGVSGRIEAGGTRNPAAFDAYLRSANVYFRGANIKDNETCIAGFTDAIRLDPAYALAYAARSLAETNITRWLTTLAAVRTSLEKAEADARKAIALAPGLSEGHLALASIHESRLQFARASEEYELARKLGPGNARVLRNCGSFAAQMGRDGLALLQHAAVLDPVNASSHAAVGNALVLLRRYPEAIAAYKNAATVASANLSGLSAQIGTAYYLLADFEKARSYCEETAKEVGSQVCLALVYKKLTRTAEAESLLAKGIERYGEAGALAYGTIYAQWGRTAEALTWLETALRLQDPGLISIKTDPLLDPLRNEPRFRAVERALHFPD